DRRKKCPGLKQCESYFGTNFVNLVSGQKTRTTLELALVSKHTSARPSSWTLNPMGESVDMDCEHHTSGTAFGHYV
ncbi:hypothetical protein AVEN_207024-2-1, partial [Araneus ventricosus]